MTSPVRQFSETLYLEARLKAGQTLELPEATERAKEDWSAERFARVVGDEVEFIPYPAPACG